MKINKLIGGILIGIGSFLILLLSGCEYKGPNSSWDELEKREKIMVEIERVEPEQAGAASELTIIGTNFSTNSEENWVYIENVRCVVKSCTDASIVIYRPNVVGNSLTIKVSVLNAINVATFSPYKMEAVVEDFGNFAGADAILATTVDQNENVYLAMNNTDVIRLKSDGSRDTEFLGTTDYSLWTDMKVSSDGYLYLARSNNIIYRLPKEGGSTEEYVKFTSRNDRVNSIDFDENDNLFGGGRKTLVVIRPDGSYEKLGYYSDYDIASVRVYNNYVYVAAENSSTGIWRHQILDQNGSLGDQESVLDWSTSPYADANIYDITFSENGVIYIATDNNEVSSIIKYNPDTGSLEPLFFEIIPSAVEQLVWGNSTYLYAVINRNTRFDQGGQLLRINTGEPGAPYYGRQ